MIRTPTAAENRILEEVMSIHGQHQEDVHDRWRELRRLGPVYVGDVLADLGIAGALSLRTGYPVFSVLGYDEAIAVLRDNETYSSGALNDSLGRVYGRTLLTMDPPEHRAARSVLASVFSRGALAQWSIDTVKPVIEAHVASLLPRGGCDLFKELLLQFPVAVLHELMGLSDEPAEIDRFHLLAMQLLLIRGEHPEVAMAAAAELERDLTAVLHDRQDRLARGEPGDDVVTQIVAANARSDAAMSDEEVVWFLRLLLPAGAETTSKASGNMMLALLRDPVQFEKVLADATLIPNAVQEALRWNGATMVVNRAARVEHEIAGVKIPAEAGVLVVIGSANRDERHFENPDMFDVTRRATGQVGFGHGIHLCLGHQMARVEMTCVLEALSEQMPRLRLDPAYPPPQVVGATFRSPDRLMVRWD